MRFLIFSALWSVSFLTFGLCPSGFSQCTDAGVEEISLKVNAPFSTATLTLNDNGVIRYEGESPKTGVAALHDTAQITTEQYDELVRFIDSSDFFSMNDAYKEEGLADATTYTVSVTKKGVVKSVSCNGQCPPQVEEIITKIKSLWGKAILEVGV